MINLYRPQSAAYDGDNLTASLAQVSKYFQVL